jgi:hypothetical protein
VGKPAYRLYIQLSEIDHVNNILEFIYSSPKTRTHRSSST